MPTHLTVTRQASSMASWTSTRSQAVRRRKRAPTRLQAVRRRMRVSTRSQAVRRSSNFGAATSIRIAPPGAESSCDASPTEWRSARATPCGRREAAAVSSSARACALASSMTMGHQSGRRPKTCSEWRLAAAERPRTASSKVAAPRITPTRLSISSVSSTWTAVTAWSGTSSPPSSSRSSRTTAGSPSGGRPPPPRRLPRPGAAKLRPASRRLPSRSGRRRRRSRSRRCGGCTRRGAGSGRTKRATASSSCCPMALSPTRPWPPSPHLRAKPIRRSLSSRPFRPLRSPPTR
mmetsp:Transcript_37238/g.109122  ORF Transcript_37238/g.109122 Transcript_37238/m.109122 type:complete len:291 (-) Transcript_37238:2040-2912(-)